MIISIKSIYLTIISRGVMFCTECGNKVDIEHRFCSNCGTYVANNISELEASLPAHKSQYRVSYTDGSWLSRITGRVVHTLIWFGIGIGLMALIFNLLTRFDVGISTNIKMSAYGLIGCYWAYSKGWNAKRFSNASAEDEETDSDSQFEDDDDITESLEI